MASSLVFCLVLLVAVFLAMSAANTHRNKRDIISSACAAIGCPKGEKGIYHYECCEGDNLTINCCAVLDESFKSFLILVAIVVGGMGLCCVAVSCCVCKFVC